MKILWLVNILFPPVAAKAGFPGDVSGGWLTVQAALLQRQPGLELVIVTSRSGSRPAYRTRVDGVEYIVVFADTIVQKQTAFQALIEEISPDIVHIHGTEYDQSLAMIRVCDAKKTLVTVQGLVHLIARHYTDGLPARLRHISFPKRLAALLLPGRNDYIETAQKAMEAAGAREIAVLQKAMHVSGRTEWDRTGVLNVNPSLHYHRTGEILRAGFYTGVWSPAHCRRHTIFLSQTGYPVKGLHVALAQMPRILHHWPDARLIIAGASPFLTGRAPLVQKAMDYLHEYQGYCKKLMARYGLKDRVSLTGPLDEKEMRRSYLNAHVFLCASSVENSPNSVAEAMMLGLPVIASRVGGIPDMIAHEKEGLLYPCEKPQMLAEEVRRVFADDALAQSLGAAARVRALARHDPVRITEQLVALYEEMGGTGPA